MSQSSRLLFVIGATLLAALLDGDQLMPVAVSPVQTGSAANQRELIAVTSKDETRIAVECAGTGPTLLFVHGGVGDRTRWTPMFPLLASKFTTCAMDRRGHGASGDSPEYRLSKEAEDVAAIVNSRRGPVRPRVSLISQVAHFNHRSIFSQCQCKADFAGPLQVPRCASRHSITRAGLSRLG